MNKFYGRSGNRLLFRMPEVPLTKSCHMHQHSQQCEEVLKSGNIVATPQAINEQMEAIKGLSLWYTNHLTAMYAIQKSKDNSNEINLKKKFESQPIVKINNALKLKQKFAPHIDLENYLNSLRSRQKEMYNFGKHNKVWDAYFEKVIPGWHELKQASKIDSSLMDQMNIKSTALRKSKIKAKSKRRNSSTRSNSDLSLTGIYKSYKSPKKIVKRYSKLKNLKKINDEPVVLESKIRNYFSTSPAVKNEQTGNINNEILFNKVYGKYLSKNEESKIEKRKKKRSKPIKKRISSDTLLLKELPKEPDNSNRRSTVKSNDGLLKPTESHLESFLLNMASNSVIERKFKNKRNRNIKKTKSKNLNFQPSFKKSNLTPSILDIARFSSKNKRYSRKLLKMAPSLMRIPMYDQRRNRKSKRFSSKSYDIEKDKIANVIDKTARSTKESDDRPVPFGADAEPFEQDEITETANITHTPKDKMELRNRLVDIVHAVWKSDKSQGGIEALHTYGTAAAPPPKLQAFDNLE